jgi:flagellar motor switch protein FliM
MTRDIVLNDEGYLHHTIPHLYIEDYIDMLNTRSYSKEDRERCSEMWDKLKEITKKSNVKVICNGKEIK